MYRNHPLFCHFSSVEHEMHETWECPVSYEYTRLERKISRDGYFSKLHKIKPSDFFTVSLCMLPNSINHSCTCKKYRFKDTDILKNIHLRDIFLNEVSSGIDRREGGWGGWSDMRRPCQGWKDRKTRKKEQRGRRFGFRHRRIRRGRPSGNFGLRNDGKLRFVCQLWRRQAGGRRSRVDSCKGRQAAYMARRRRR